MQRLKRGVHVREEMRRAQTELGTRTQQKRKEAFTLKVAPFPCVVSSC